MMPSIKEQLSKKIEKIEQTIDFYLPVENRFFNEPEVPDDVMKLAWLVKDLFPDDLFDYEEDVKNAGFTLGDKDWKPEGGQAA